MPNNEKDEWEFPPEIKAAFEAYPQPRFSRGFETRFWEGFEARRGRYRGITGWLRRLLELEIEGVLVWRLALSTCTGGVAGVLVLGLAFGFTQHGGASVLEPLAPLSPSQRTPDQIPAAPMTAFAFYNRNWENELLIPQQKPKMVPHKVRPQEKDFSWTGSNGHLA